MPFGCNFKTYIVAKFVNCRSTFARDHIIFEKARIALKYLFPQALLATSPYFLCNIGGFYVMYIACSLP